MTTSDIIQIISIIVGTITSIVSIYIAVKSLKQANKSIIDANRSDVVIYSDYIQVNSQIMHYLIIKNFGRSSAVIDSIEFSNNNFYAINKPFYNLSNCSIAPNQAYSSRVKYKNDPYISFEVTIQYHDSINNYSKTFSINTEAIAKQLVGLITSDDQGPLEKTISTIGQELLRKNL